jgi:ketosteroid isomerase-like protein
MSLENGHLVSIVQRFELCGEATANEKNAPRLSPTVTHEHPDALAYRRTADAFRSGDLDLVGTLVAPEVVWHVPGEHHMAGTIEGRDALLAWLAQLGSIGPWLVERDVFASDDHVCAISTFGVRRDGVDVQTRVVSIFRYRDGRQVERWFYPDDIAAWDAIFAA